MTRVVEWDGMEATLACGHRMWISSKPPDHLHCFACDPDAKMTSPRKINAPRQAERLL